MNLNENYNKLKSILGLSLSLAKANFKVRNEGSYLGIFWYLLEPLCFFLVIILLRAVINQKSIDSYPLYLFLGLIMFNFFNGATGISSKILVQSSGFIKSMNIHKEAFVISVVLQYIFSHIFEMILFIFFIIYFKASLSGLIYYPFIFIFLCLFTLGISFILSTIGVYINDLFNVWNVVMRVLWFATPIFYVLTEESILYRFNLFNPMYYFLDNARQWIIYNTIPSINSLLIMIMLGIGIFAIGLIIFEKNKIKFAEMM
ncbi:MAG: ABC transporter permease [Candidatus Nanoarchaeia archaeon]|nr:ABC transporter permease [Candidatus Nanoarchaeia archaeon]